MAQEHDQICPFCFTIYPEGVLDPEVPVCRECNAFGRAMILEDYGEFIQATPLAQVEAIQKSWLERGQFLEAEREMVLKNIQHILEKLKSE